MKRHLLIVLLLCAATSLIAQEGYIQLPPDSTGKKLRMFQQTISSQTVYAQGYFLTNTAGSEIGLATSPLFVRFTDGAAAYDAAKESTLAGIKTGTDRIPSSPATDRTTAAAPFSMRLSDGSAFIDPRDVSDRSGRQLGAIANSGFNVNNLPSTYPNQQSNKTADYDSGAGTDTVTMFGIALQKSGGAVAGGTSTDPIRTDPTGTTTQPVSGTVTANAGSGTFNIQANASVNETQIAGTAIDVNSGNKSGGTQRMVIATDQPQLTNALKVDGSAVTQPISGTVTANIGTTNGLALDATLTGGSTKAIARGAAKGSTAAGDITSENVDANTQALHVFVKNASIAVTGTFWQATQPVSIATTISTNVAQLAGTTTDTNSGNKSAGTLRVVLATDQPQLTNKLLVTPDANSAVNVAQVNGVATTTGNGISGTGVQRVTIASDSTGQVSLATGANTIGALTANQSVNDNQVGGAAILTGNGVTGAGSQRVTVASDNTPFAVKTDQTTHGTTDQVAADITKVNGASVNTGTGTAGTGTQRVAVASDSSITANIGTTNGLALDASVAAAQPRKIQDSSGNPISATSGALTVIVMQMPNAPPVLSTTQLSNPLLYRAAMQQYCQKNLCPGR